LSGCVLQLTCECVPLKTNSKRMTRYRTKSGASGKPPTFRTTWRAASRPQPLGAPSTCTLIAERAKSCKPRSQPPAPPSSAPSSASNAAHKIGVVLHAGSSSWAGSKGGRQASSVQCLPQGAGREEEAWREVTCQALARCICMAAGADGRVLGVQVFSDSLYPDLMDALALALQGMCPCILSCALCEFWRSSGPQLLLTREWITNDRQDIRQRRHRRGHGPASRRFLACRPSSRPGGSFASSRRLAQGLPVVLGLFSPLLASATPPPHHEGPWGIKSGRAKPRSTQAASTARRKPVTLVDTIATRELVRWQVERKLNLFHVKTKPCKPASALRCELFPDSPAQRGKSCGVLWRTLTCSSTWAPATSKADLDMRTPEDRAPSSCCCFSLESHDDFNHQ